MAIPTWIQESRFGKYLAPPAISNELNEAQETTYLDVLEKLLYWVLVPATLFIAVIRTKVSLLKSFAIGAVIAAVYIASAIILAVYCCYSKRWRCYREMLLAAGRPNFYVHNFLAEITLKIRNSAILPIESVMSTVFTALVIKLFDGKSSIWGMLVGIILIPPMIGVMVAVLMVAANLPCPTWLMVPAGVCAVLCIPLAMLYVCALVRKNWTAITYDTICPTFMMCFLTLGLVPLFVRYLCLHAHLMGYMDYATVNELTLFFATPCSTAAVILIKELKGEAIAYTIYGTMVTLFSPVSMGLIIYFYL